MNDINKQRFLPELGKLLTFMVEQDRQTALAMYSRLFDDAEDEQKLMDLLVSPTRQAVVIARTYDARARKQQLESGAPANEETPGFVLAIDKIYQEVAPDHVDEPAEEIEPAALLNQFSLFPDDVHPIDDSEYVPFKIEADTVPIEEPVEELPVEAETAAEPAPEEETEPAPEEAEEEAPVQESPAEEERAIPSEPEEAPAEELPVDAKPADEPVTAVPMPEETPISVPDPVELDYIPETQSKPKVFALILYVLFAVPLTMIGILLLLIPTVLALALAVGVIAGGSFLFMSAFSGFPKLADILIVLGTAVVILALGLLLLWLFVWFIGGVIGGLIRGVVNLGRKWCYEEVPV